MADPSIGALHNRKRRKQVSLHCLPNLVIRLCVSPQKTRMPVCVRERTDTEPA